MLRADVQQFELRLVRKVALHDADLRSRQQLGLYLIEFERDYGLWHVLVVEFLRERLELEGPLPLKESQKNLKALAILQPELRES